MPKPRTSQNSKPNQRVVHLLPFILSQHWIIFTSGAKQTKTETPTTVGQDHTRLSTRPGRTFLPFPKKHSQEISTQTKASVCLLLLCAVALGKKTTADTQTHATMFQWKSNSEKFFKCFQHISMKHRPSWNHLDLKQMH